MSVPGSRWTMTTIQSLPWKSQSPTKSPARSDPNIIGVSINSAIHRSSDITQGALAKYYSDFNEVLQFNSRLENASEPKMSSSNFRTHVFSRQKADAYGSYKMQPFRQSTERRRETPHNWRTFWPSQNTNHSPWKLLHLPSIMTDQMYNLTEGLLLKGSMTMMPISLIL